MSGGDGADTCRVEVATDTDDALLRPLVRIIGGADLAGIRLAYRATQSPL